MDEIRIKAYPLPILFCKYFHTDAVANGRCCQFFPFVEVRAHLQASANQLVAFHREAGDSFVGRGQQFEVEWCNIHRNGHANVVRIDGSLFLYLLVVGRHLCLLASHQREYGDQE